MTNAFRSSSTPRCRSESARCSSKLFCTAGDASLSTLTSQSTRVRTMESLFKRSRRASRMSGGIMATRRSTAERISPMDKSGRSWIVEGLIGETPAPSGRPQMLPVGPRRRVRHQPTVRVCNRLELEGCTPLASTDVDSRPTERCRLSISRLRALHRVTRHASSFLYSAARLRSSTTTRALHDAPRSRHDSRPSETSPGRADRQPLQDSLRQIPTILSPLFGPISGAPTPPWRGQSLPCACHTTGSSSAVSSPP